MVIEQKHIDLFNSWRADWNKFVRDVLHARLDREQQAIITSIQTNPMTAVASGTARGKDFVAACGSLCFMYLTPTFDERGRLVPYCATGRQYHVTGSSPFVQGCTIPAG